MGQKGAQGKHTPGQSSKQARRGKNIFRKSTRQQDTGSQVPILCYGLENNFQRFKERLAAEALKDYGDLGLIIETERYYDPPAVDVSDYDLTPAGDPHGGNKILYYEALKSRASEIKKMREKRTSLYASIWQKLSAESVDEVKRHADYTTFNEQKDPLALWKAISSTHKVYTTSKVDAIIKLSS